MSPLLLLKDCQLGTKCALFLLMLLVLITVPHSWRNFKKNTASRKVRPEQLAILTSGPTRKKIISDMLQIMVVSVTHTRNYAEIKKKFQELPALMSYLYITIITQR